MREGIHKTTLEFREELWEQIKAAAKARRMSVIGWMENAAVSQLGREQRYAAVKEQRDARAAAEGKRCEWCDVPAVACRNAAMHEQEGAWV